jgi:hypothetical protein
LCDLGRSAGLSGTELQFNVPEAPDVDDRDRRPLGGSACRSRQMKTTMTAAVRKPVLQAGRQIDPEAG